jgi:hypothetical protein
VNLLGPFHCTSRIGSQGSDRDGPSGSFRGSGGPI